MGGAGGGRSERDTQKVQKKKKKKTTRGTMGLKWKKVKGETGDKHDVLFSITVGKSLEAVSGNGSLGTKTGKSHKNWWPRREGRKERLQVSKPSGGVM